MAKFDTGDPSSVNPWNEDGKSVDYDRILQGENYKDCEKVDDELIKRIEKITGKPVHHFLKRGLVISHSKMNDILDLYEARKPFYLFTGRGPSSESLHLGHLVPFMFTKWLQETFDVPLVIQLADDEKYLWKETETPEKAVELSRKNAADIIAFGFDEKKTFIFSNFEYMCPPFYKNICRIGKLVTVRNVMEKFKINEDDSIGKTSYPAIQAAPSFSSSFPEIFPGAKNIACLVPCGLDQHNFFQVLREVAPDMKCTIPSEIHTTFLPPLTEVPAQPEAKMSASYPKSAIYLNDKEKEIEDKIDQLKTNDSVGSGMGPDDTGVRENAGADIPYQLAKYFVEDESEWNRINQEKVAGKILKKRLILIIKKTVREIQEKRENVTDDIVTKFMSPRPLHYKFQNGS